MHRMIAAPRAIETNDHAELLALNNAHSSELSWQTSQAFTQLLSLAWHARTIGAAEALLIALDQDANYDNPNFAWLAARYARFVYLDRVVVAGPAQRQGYAAQLYRELIEHARAAGHQRLVCEINLQPPNPVSIRFHQRMGFAQVGQATLANGKTVGYFELAL